MVYLFSQWDKIKKNLEGKFLYFFLDYDGTLSPIAKTPDVSFTAKKIKKTLRTLSKSLRCKIAIISGRALKDVKGLLDLKEVVYVGNHGLEIEGPKLRFNAIAPTGFKEILKRIKSDLDKRLSAVKGVLLEDKGYTLSVHYRLVNKKYIPLVKTVFHETIITDLIRNKIKINSGKMLLEVRPPLEWNKGKAVLWLLARQKFALKGNEILPIYMGDDVTDEDAFDALKDKGITIFVGRPKISKAQYYLKNPKQVAQFLKKVLDLQRA